MIAYKERVWGFDVSQYQNGLDFEAMKAAGASFCFVRASTGLSGGIDRYAVQNVNKAEATGLHVGVYHYLSSAMTMEDQAQLFYTAMCQVNVLRLDLPAVIDAEDRKLTVRDVSYFVERMRDLRACRYMIYTGVAAWKAIRRGGNEVFIFPELWIAHWNVDTPTVPFPWPEWTFWQCGQTNRREFGEKGLLDINVFNGSLPELREYGAEVQRGL